MRRRFGPLREHRSTCYAVLLSRTASERSSSRDDAVVHPANRRRGRPNLHTNTHTLERAYANKQKCCIIDATLRWTATTTHTHTPDIRLCRANICITYLIDVCRRACESTDAQTTRTTRSGDNMHHLTAPACVCVCVRRLDKSSGPRSTMQRVHKTCILYAVHLGQLSVTIDAALACPVSGPPRQQLFDFRTLSHTHTHTYNDVDNIGEPLAAVAECFIKPHTHSLARAYLACAHVIFMTARTHMELPRRRPTFISHRLSDSLSYVGAQSPIHTIIQSRHNRFQLWPLSVLVT